MQKTKICIACKVEKSLVEYGKATSNKTGVNNKCKECVKEYNRQYWNKNKERLSEYSRKYQMENRDEIKKQRTEYASDNKDKIRRQNREYYHRNINEMRLLAKNYYNNNKDAMLYKAKDYYLKNRDAMLESNREWHQSNPEKARRISQRYEARKNSVEQTLTIDQWEETLSYFNNGCAYCGMSGKQHREGYGEQLHQDHIIPLVDSGPYSKDNVIPACRSCNSSKSDRDMIDWYFNHRNFKKENLFKIINFIGINSEEYEREFIEAELLEQWRSKIDLLTIETVNILGDIRKRTNELTMGM